jgi:hypothetical protein
MNSGGLDPVRRSRQLRCEVNSVHGQSSSERFESVVWTELVVPKQT